MSTAKIPHDKAEKFCLAGKATVIFHNTQSGNFHKYKITKHRTYDLWYVQTADHFVNKVIGRIFPPNSSHSKHWFKPDEVGSRIYPKDNEVFIWMWKRITHMLVPSTIDILHDGICGRCAKPLTDPSSVESGYGPECRHMLGISIK